MLTRRPRLLVPGLFFVAAASIALLAAAPWGGAGPARAQDAGAPTLTIDPPQGLSGTQATITASGFPPGATVLIDGAADFLFGEAGADGRFSAADTFFGCAADQVIVTASAADETITASAAFTVTGPACEGAALSPGSNYVLYTGPTQAVEEALGPALSAVVTVWYFDPATQRWRSWSSGLPAALQSLQEVETGTVYVVVTRTAAAWPFALPAAVGAQASIALVRGLNPVRYEGPTRPVETVLGASRSAMKAIWHFDNATQRWASWNPALPAVLQGVRDLVNGEVYLFDATVATTLTISDDFPIDPTAADQIVIDQVIQPDSLAHDLLAFRHPDPVQPGDVIRPGGDRDGAAALTVEHASWLYWLDDAPGAKFAHDTRVVLVDRSTGATTVHDLQWWPQLNGENLFTDLEANWTESNWVFARLEIAGPPTPLESAQAVLVQADGTISPALAAELRDAQQLLTPVPPGECAIVINGWAPGDTGQNQFTLDQQGMAGYFTGQGFTKVTQVSSPNNGPLNVGAAIKALADDPACDDIVIYITTHGYKATATAGSGVKLGAGRVSHQTIADYLKTFPRVTFKLLVDACFSGGMVTPAAAVDNIATTITATNATTPSYFDLDANRPQSLGGGTFPVADPNPTDTGSEFTSGLREDLQQITEDLRGNPAKLLQYAEAAAVNGLNSVMEVILYCAYNSAVAKDVTALNGATVPQRSRQIIEIIGQGEATQFIPFRCP